jgi:hypothetical protein
MVRSSVASAPTIICVLCPPGAKCGAAARRGVMDEGRDCSLRACRASSMRTAMRAMERVMAAPFFCGASAARPSRVGSSTLMLRRSA